MSKDSDPPGDGPSSPNINEIRALLKTFIKVAVSTCNKELANLEQTSEQVSMPLVATLKDAKQQGEFVVRKVVTAYETRHEYGPHIIAGSALFFGSIVGLRRGRLPAFAVGTAFGFAAYLAVYEVNIYKFPEIVFDKKKED